mmetsp:Transcript_17707/g.20403  ORF Transcript_17707/g.20403 Transcript_17707/m.20403 type:complete len:425 (+) Transcript_17707:53-1327(+)|eukprot:CAMPEP_0194367850 /NCGR_PEP_ID=MMETSP0174-20130528/16020_1 /TAXON_ID=216777 /ORGANISM="Proboscia alata, Strain PI-D3" /LENGTH=424 /DNA_ID=CAMNT_0039143891 /DNA_START=29 /DNA_END=1303 /DNA_ORIENTATION=-
MVDSCDRGLLVIESPHVNPLENFKGLMNIHTTPPELKKEVSRVVSPIPSDSSEDGSDIPFFIEKCSSLKKGKEGEPNFKRSSFSGPTHEFIDENIMMWYQSELLHQAENYQLDRINMVKTCNAQKLENERLQHENKLLREKSEHLTQKIKDGIQYTNSNLPPKNPSNNDKDICNDNQHISNKEICDNLHTVIGNLSDSIKIDGAPNKLKTFKKKALIMNQLQSKSWREGVTKKLMFVEESENYTQCEKDLLISKMDTISFSTKERQKQINSVEYGLGKEGGIPMHSGGDMTNKDLFSHSLRESSILSRCKRALVRARSDCRAAEKKFQHLEKQYVNLKVELAEALTVKCTNEIIVGNVNRTNHILQKSVDVENFKSKNVIGTRGYQRGKNCREKPWSKNLAEKRDDGDKNFMWKLWDKMKGSSF